MTRGERRPLELDDAPRVARIDRTAQVSGEFEAAFARLCAEAQRRQAAEGNPMVADERPVASAEEDDAPHSADGAYAPLADIDVVNASPAESAPRMRPKHVASLFWALVEVFGTPFGLGVFGTFNRLVSCSFFVLTFFPFLLR